MRYIIIVILSLITIGSAFGQRNRIELWQLKYAQAAGYVPYSKANGEYEATALSSLITGVSIDDAFVLNDSLYFVFSDGDTLNAGYLPLSATIIDSLYMQGDSLVITQDTTINKVDLSQFRQTLTISNDTLFISGGNSVVLPASGGGTDTSGYNNYFNLSSQTLSIGDANDTLTVTLPIVGINAGTGITTNAVNGVVTITNTAPDQVVSITGGGINAVSGTYPNFTITGTEVDGSVTNEGRLGVGAGGANTSTLTTNTSGSNAVTFAGGTGISLTESTSTNGGTITITNSAPDQTVSITGSTGITVGGSYPNFSLSVADQSATNELQNLNLSGQTLSISSGNNVTLPVIGITAGTGISTSTTSGNVTITNALPEATSARNVNASGEGIYRAEVANELQFKKLIAGSNVTLTSADSTITIASSGGGGVDTATFLQQDSILIYSVAGVEFGRDTIRTAAPDQTVSLTGGTSIGVTGTYPNFTINNTAPDQTVTITGAGINSVSGTYPNFTITGTEVDGSVTNEGRLGVGAGGANTSTLTTNTSGSNAVTFAGGTGISLTESTSTNGGTITITNNAADQTVVLNAGTGITTSGTYPNFTITNSAPDQVVTLAGTGITTISGSYPSFTINSTEVDGDTTNELQTLSRNQDTIFISNGNYVILPAASGIDSIFQSGDTVYIVAAGDTSFFVIPPAVGDNWGSQVVISDTTLVGDGTSGNPLGVDTTQIATHYYISEGFTTKYIDFDTLYANNYQEGRMKWNVDENSVEIGLSPNLSGTTLMDDFWYVKNQSGDSIPKGSVVYASGTLGTSGRILIDKYIANGTIDSKYVLGVVAETIPDGEDGHVMTKGKIRGINTSAYVDGTVLWASTAVAGTLTDTVPVAPNFRLPLAFVVHADANGILAVRTTTGSDLYEDHRVQVTAPTADQLLKYNGTNQRWENWTPNYSTADTSGRNNYLALSNDTLYVGDDNDTLNVLLPYYPNTNPNGYISSFTDTSGYNNYFNLSSQTLSIGDANDTLAVTLPIVGVSAGTGITVNTTSGVATVTNAAPDQTVVLTAGTGISTSGTYPNFTIANTSPDQTVTISGTGITVGGTYPSFTLTAADTSATNELQTLSISNDTLSISGGNSVVLPAGGGGGDTLNYLAISNDTLFVGDTNDTLSVKLTNAAVLQIVDITVTTDTLELADLGKLVRCNNAAAITLRIPTNTNHAFPIGSIVTVEQVGAGVVTITPISGVTINPTARKTWGQYSVIQLIKVGTNTWNVVGGID